MFPLRYFYLLAVFSFFTSPVFAGAGGSSGGMGAIPSSIVHCEFLLSSSEEDQSLAKGWLNNLFWPIEKIAEAKIDSAILPEGLRVIGLPADTNTNQRLWMKIRVPVQKGESFWIDLESANGIVKSYAFHIPPLFVWKEEDLIESDEGLATSLKPNSLDIISFGIVLKEIVGGRLYISLKGSARGELKVTIGVDLDADHLELYSDSLDDLEFVATAPDRKLLSRIGLVSGTFYVAHESPSKGVN